MSTHPDHFVRKYARGLLDGCEFATPEEITDSFNYLYKYAVILPRSEDLRDDTSLVAAGLLVQLAERTNHPRLLHAYSNLINKLVELPWLGLDRWTRLARLQSLPKNLSIAAALCAIEHNDLPLAVALLDRSRCLTFEHSRRLYPARSDMDRLKAISRDVYDRVDMLIRRLRVGMAGVPPRAIANESESAKQSRCNYESEYTRHAQELDETLHRIREQAGLERFMLPCSDEAALRLVEVGPVVVLLPAAGHCSAILITKSNDDLKMKHLLLPGLSEGSAGALAGKLVESLRAAGRHCRGASLDDSLDGSILTESPRYFVPNWQKPSNTSEAVMLQTLSQLWVCVGLPVVKALGLSKSSDPPRIFLYPTGVLSSLPIHVAGIYGSTTSGANIQEYMTPSYITSLRSINHIPLPDSPPQVFAVGQAKSPGQAPIPFVTEEIQRIRASVPAADLIALENESADLLSVVITLGELVSSERPLVLHLACHGAQSPYNADPLSSSLHMYDKPFIMSHIMTSPIPYGALAVLSACETATLESQSSPDEMLHIGATMQYLGFRSVVASMWAIEDKDGPEIAGSMYAQLFREEGGGVGGSAKALWVAVGNLRKKGVSSIRWGSFVHIGL
ncbi:hypothetical protein BDV93DRAFT_499441 [Ceratobasidium sp. AG-I]|nr:hypothetical protein BDV93DRAFT_499441 [Ceratobasidium sp. AG-I]